MPWINWLRTVMKELSPSKFVPDSPWLVPKNHKPVEALSYSPTSLTWRPPKLIPEPLYFYFGHKFPNRSSLPGRIAYPSSPVHFYIQRGCKAHKCK